MTYKEKGNQTVRCLECGEVISFGRSDRKFCSEKCKNDYNNRKVRVTRNYKLRVMNAIDKNYDILERLVKMKVKSMDISEMKMLGYQPDFSTSYHKVKGHNEYWCYDIKFFLSDTRIFSIQKMLPCYKDKSE